MTLLTALEIAFNYPENIQICSAQGVNGKYGGLCYLLREGQIHKLLLSTQPVFESEKEANNALHEIAIACKNKYTDKAS